MTPELEQLLTRLAAGALEVVAEVASSPAEQAELEAQVEEHFRATQQFLSGLSSRAAARVAATEEALQRKFGGGDGK